MVVLSAFLAFGFALTGVPGAGGGDGSRIVSQKTRLQTRAEPGAVEVETQFGPDGLTVRVWSDADCFVDTVQTTVIERFRSEPDALPGGIAVAGAGLLGLGGAGFMAYIAPGQPSLDDDFSRGELSKEGAYGIAVITGLIGISAVAVGSSFALLGGKTVLGSEEKEVVLKTAPLHGSACPSPNVSGAYVTVTTWNGIAHSEHVDQSGVVRVPLVSMARTMPSDEMTDWACVLVQIGGETVVDESVDPPGSLFVESLNATGSISDLERFHSRFGEGVAWESLKPRYNGFVAAREAEAAATLERQLAEEARQAAKETRRRADLVAKARSALDAGDLPLALAAVRESGESIRVEAPALVATIEDRAAKAGRAFLLKAVALAKRDKVGEAYEQLAKAEAHGVEADETQNQIFTLAAGRAEEKKRDSLNLPESGHLMIEALQSFPWPPTSIRPGECTWISGTAALTRRWKCDSHLNGQLMVYVMNASGEYARLHVQSRLGKEACFKVATDELGANALGKRIQDRSFPGTFISQTFSNPFSPRGLQFQVNWSKMADENRTHCTIIAKDCSVSQQTGIDRSPCR